MNLWHISSDDLIKLANEKEIEIPLSDGGRLNRKKLIGILTEAMVAAGETVDAVALDADGNAEEVEIVKNTKTKPKGGWVDIVFHNQEGGTKTVFLGLNGRSLYLGREIPYRIPAEFMNVVRSAVQTKITQRVNDQRRVETTEVRVPRFSYEVLATGQ